MIKIQSVSKSFGPQTLFENLSLEIQAQETLFILGKSGTGKSVLLRLLVGLLRPDSGTVKVHNTIVSSASVSELAELREKVGLIFQQPALFEDLDVYENIAFGLRRKKSFSDHQMDQKIKEILHWMRLEKQTHSDVKELSFGEQKRVSLARALVLSPEVLLFDEPTTGLDPELSRSIDKLIQRTREDFKTTCLVVSHDMESAWNLADRILFLEKGKIEFEGSKDQIQSSSSSLVQSFFSELSGSAKTNISANKERS